MGRLHRGIGPRVRVSRVLFSDQNSRSRASVLALPVSALRRRSAPPRNSAPLPEAASRNRAPCPRLSSSILRSKLPIPERLFRVSMITSDCERTGTTTGGFIGHNTRPVPRWGQLPEDNRLRGTGLDVHGFPIGEISSLTFGCANYKPCGERQLHLFFHKLESQLKSGVQRVHYTKGRGRNPVVTVYQVQRARHRDPDQYKYTSEEKFRFSGSNKREVTRAFIACLEARNIHILCPKCEGRGTIKCKLVDSDKPCDAPNCKWYSPATPVRC